MMRTLRNLLLGGLCSIAALMACNGDKQADSRSFQKEKAGREVKKLSEADIMTKGQALGDAIVDTVQRMFQQELMTAIQEGGIAGAIGYCHLNASTLAASFEDSLGISIRRATDRPRNPADSLTGIEKEIFEAYLYDPEVASAQLQQLDDRSVIYTKPIRIQTGVCLNCHGTVGEQVTRENYELIQSRYPDDKATGYQPGELRGMWSVRIPRKTIVDQL